MKTRIQITIDVEVEIENTESNVLSSHHGWGNAMYETYKGVDGLVKQTISAQFTAQHSELLEKAAQKFNYPVAAYRL